MNRVALSLFTVVASFLVAGAAQAQQTLEPIEVFKRCYTRMARLIPQENSPLYQAVKNGSMTAENACLAVFDKAAFGADMILKNRTDFEAKRVLKTFHDLHQSWFEAKEFSAVSGVSFLIHDLESPALYFTRAAFQPGARFDSVVQLQSGLEGVRDRTGALNNFDAQRVFTYFQKATFATEKNLLISYDNRTYDSAKGIFVNHGIQAVTVPTADILDQGALVGVKPALSIRLPSYVPTIDMTGFSAADKSSLGNSAANVDVNAHYGGGVMGSQVFMLDNANLTFSALANSYSSINRRLSARIFQDLLCHQLPSLNDSDVTTEVKPASTYTFQQQSTCMRCHSSVDGLGFMFRNFVIANSSTLESVQTVGAPATFMAQLPPVAGSLIFAMQPPAGRLHYREMLGGPVVDANVSNFQQVGQRLASGNDLYLCGAKRYYTFFTGVDVDLTQQAESGTLDRYHQDNVRMLAQTLKSKQSVREMLSAIFNSDVFHHRNYMTEKVQ